MFRQVVNTPKRKHFLSEHSPPICGLLKSLAASYPKFGHEQFSPGNGKPGHAHVVSRSTSELLRDFASQ